MESLTVHSDAGPFFVIIVIAAIIVVGVLAIVAAYKRRKDLRALAAAKGLRFAPHDAFGLPNVYGETKLCSRGHSRKAGNVIYGPFGESEVRYFDYRYTVGSGKNSHTYYVSACAMHTDLHFAPLIVRHESVFDKVAGFFGFDDIDLDNAEFNKRYYVGCDDKKYAYDILSQRMMQFFLDRLGVTMEMRWNYLLFYYNGRLSVEKVSGLIDSAVAFLALLPNYLRQERSMSAKTAPAATKRTEQEGSRMTFDGISPQRRRPN